MKMGKLTREFQQRLKRRCDALSPSQRRKVLVALSAVYLLLTAAVVIPAFCPQGRKAERKIFDNIENGAVAADTSAMRSETEQKRIWEKT